MTRSRCVAAIAAVLLTLLAAACSDIDPAAEEWLEGWNAWAEEATALNAGFDEAALEPDLARSTTRALEITEELSDGAGAYADASERIDLPQEHAREHSLEVEAWRRCEAAGRGIVETVRAAGGDLDYLSDEEFIAQGESLARSCDAANEASLGLGDALGFDVEES